MKDITPPTVPEDTERELDALLGRSHRLGATTRITNRGGGNTSAKVVTRDPISGDAVEVLFVKGSGGDLATLQLAGLGRLDVCRVRALRDRYAGDDDAMVPLLDHCRFGIDGAVPSIDTFLHAFLDDAHVDHTHPDAVIALAVAREAPGLVTACFGDAIGWLAWRRPGFRLALELEALRAERPGMVGAVLGGHGLICWGETSDECEQTTLTAVVTAESFLRERGRANPFGTRSTTGAAPRPSDHERRARVARLGPLLRGLSSHDGRVVGSFDDSDAVLELLAGDDLERLVALGTSCPDHFLRTRVRPILLPAGVDGDADSRRDITRAYEQYRADYVAYYERFRTTTSPPRRGADPVIVLVAGLGMWSFGPDATAARVAGEFYRSTIAVMRGAESLSSYEPIADAEKFSVEYWELEEAKLRRRPPAPPLAGRVALVTGAGSGIGRATAIRLAQAGAAMVASDRDEASCVAVADEIGEMVGDDQAMALTVDVADEDSVRDAFDSACRRFGGIDLVVNSAGLSISAPLTETTTDQWDLQHRVMARGSFLVSRAAARVMIDQELGGDIVYIVSKNALVAGADNVAYGSAKADQAHQVRLLAAELGGHGIRVNGVNPDAVVRGSGIFADGWGAQRAALYGVAEDELSHHYATRTLLGSEIFPEDIAEAVAVLVGPALGKTTGLLVPVDGGLPGAFLR